MKTEPKDLIHSFNHIEHCEGNFKGLTKREHFAGLALQGLLASVDIENFCGPLVAECAVRMADNLIESLNQ